MKTNTHFPSYLAHAFLELEISQINVVEKTETRVSYSISFFFLNRAVYEITWKNTAESTGHRLRYDACGLHAGIPKATNSFSEYVILLFFHCNSCCTKAPHNRIMHTLPVLLYYLRTTAYVHELAFPLKISLSCLSLNFLLHATCHDR